MKAESAMKPCPESDPLSPDVRARLDALVTRLLVDGAGSVGENDLLQLAEAAELAGRTRLSQEAARLAEAAAKLEPEAFTQELAALAQWMGELLPAPALTGLEAGNVSAAVANTAQSAVKAPGIAEDLELLSDFAGEAREHLTAIEGELLTLEQDPQNATVMNAIFRASHTIKGMAGFLELETVQRVAHHVETVLDLARNFKLLITPLVVDLVLESADFLRVAVRAAELRAAGERWVEQEFPAALIARLEAVHLDPVSAVKVQAPMQMAAAAEGTSRQAANAPAAEVPSADQHGPREGEILPPVAAAFMQPVLPGDRRQPGSATSAATGTSEVTTGSASSAAVQQAAPTPGKTVDPNTVRVETGKLDHLLEMIGEMVIAQSLVEQHPAMASLQEPLLTANLLLLSRITKDVQSAAMGVRMNPIGQLFQRSARLVRDMSRRAGKDVKLELTGEDTEIDRKIAEELADPLMHMIRNALDHGIETPAERAASGKSLLATLRLAAYHQGGQIVVEIADDGRGLNRQKILAKAVQNQLIDGAAELSEDEVNHLIFEPGFSTAETITDISGRGVGMDVVKRQVQKLRGRIEIQSTLGVGTQFFLKLPLTLAILDVLIVGVGVNRYLLPIASVRQIFRPTPEMLSSIHGKSEMVLQHDRLLPIVRLHQRFGVESRTVDPCVGLLIEAECEGRVFCVMVDEMLGRQEVVMKALGEIFKGIAGVSSCAILGDGRVGLILDMAGIFAAPMTGPVSVARGTASRSDAGPGGVPAYLAESFAGLAAGVDAQRAHVAGSASMGR